MKPFLTLVLTVLSLGATAQADSTRPKPQFKLSLNYLSSLHYYGRTDSIPGSGYFPLAEFWATPNFYVNAAPIFVSTRGQSVQYAGSVATVGYQKVTKRWIASAYVLKPFYTEEARLVQSALKAQTGASFTSLHKALNLTLGADVKFSNAVDYGATAAIDHLVRLQRGRNVFLIDPSLTVNAGTQQFSRTYVQKGGGSNPLPLPLPGNGANSNSTVTETGRRFTLLSWEASVPLIYVRSQWMLLLTPAYVAPQNLLTGEYGKPMAYVSATVKYTF